VKKEKREEKRGIWLACSKKVSATLSFEEIQFAILSLSLSLCCLFGVEISECEAVIYAQDAF
jgi:hypothetical protein